jgi:putative MATE family efflux protein
MLFAGAMDDTLGASSDYLTILSIGMAVQAMSMTICAAQRGVGNTKITMKTNITANVVNICLNYLLIEGRFGFPRLEVAGAAIATVIGRFVGFLLALLSVLKKDSYLRLSPKGGWRPDMPTLKNIGRLTGGSALEQAAMRVGFFVYAKSVANLGTNDFAAHVVAMQLMNLSFTFADGIGAATTSLVGQNLGAKRPDLSIMYGKVGQRLALSVAVVLGIVSYFARFFFASLFTADADIIQVTAGLVIILACLLPLQTSQIVMAGSLRGAGDTRYVAMTMIVSVAMIRPFSSIFLIYAVGLGLKGAWYAIAIDQTVRLLMLFTRFSRGRWISINV